MSETKHKFNESLEGFGIKTNGKKEVFDENHTLAERAGAMQDIAKKRSNADEEPMMIADNDMPLSKRREALMKEMAAAEKKKDVNHDETELLKEAWVKTYKNCLVNIEAAMRSRRMTIAELRQEVEEKKSNFPKATRDFILNTNPKYIEGWLSRMFNDYFETLDWINERDQEAGAEEVNNG